MNGHKLILAIFSLVVAFFFVMPQSGFGKEPAKPAAKEKAAAKKPASTEEVSPEDIKVGGKSLSQWRAIFGESAGSPDIDTIFSKSDVVQEKTAKAKPQMKPTSPSSAGQAERQTIDRIIGETQKVYWTRLAVIANNMANVDTVGYKRNRTLLEGSDSWPIVKGDDWSKRGQLATAGISTRGGGPVLSVQTDFTQGRLKKTGRMLDIAIEGKGFLQVIKQNTSETLYTRAGNLSINDEGQLCVGPARKGWLIEPGITVPLDATAITVKNDGCVYVKQPGTVKLTQVGQVQMARFINSEGLQRLGGKLFGETESSGVVILSNPGEDSCGIMRQGYLEQSNVDLSKERDDWKVTVERIDMLELLLPK